MADASRPDPAQRDLRFALSPMPSPDLYPEFLEHLFRLFLSIFRDHHFPQWALADVPLILFGHVFLFFDRGPHTLAHPVHPFLINPRVSFLVIRLFISQAALFVFLSATAGARIIAA
jgi:hypothetical protein